MAKIYETQEDIKRERLADEVRTLAEGSHSLNSTGIMAITAGVLGIQLDEAERNAAHLAKEPLPMFHGLTKWMAILTGGLGLAALFLGHNAERKANKLRTELDAMGPQEIMVPESAVENATKEGKPMGLPNHGEGKHVYRLRNADTGAERVI